MTKNNTDRQNYLTSLKSFMAIKEKWKNFYQNLGLASLIGTLDSWDVFIDITKPREDFEIILLPPVEVQRQYLTDLKYACEGPINGYDPGEIWLSPDTVGPNFPNNISFEDRPKNSPYILCLENSQEPPEETIEMSYSRVKSGSELKSIFKKKKRTGLTLFEYLVFRRNFISQRVAEDNKNPFPDTPDTMYSTWLLNSSLPDGRILVAGADINGMLKIWVWPKTYKEHNCQGARWGIVVHLA